LDQNFIAKMKVIGGIAANISIRESVIGFLRKNSLFFSDMMKRCVKTIVLSKKDAISHSKPYSNKSEELFFHRSVFMAMETK